MQRSRSGIERGSRRFRSVPAGSGRATQASAAEPVKLV